MNPLLSGEDAKLLHKVSLLMTAFRNVNPTMSIQVCHTLALIAIHEGVSLVELGRISGFKMSTISRNILDLGTRNRKREPGYGLVETVTDPMELRKKKILLTSKGRELIRQVLDIMKV